jgi:hypothetical protein
LNNSGLEFAFSTWQPCIIYLVNSSLIKALPMSGSVPTIFLDTGHRASSHPARVLGPVFRNYTSATFLVRRRRGVLKASWTGPSSFLGGLDRRNCLIRKGLLSDLANGRSADGRGVLRRTWTRQRQGPLQMSARTWSAIRNTGLGTTRINCRFALPLRSLLLSLVSSFSLHIIGVSKLQTNGTGGMGGS